MVRRAVLAVGMLLLLGGCGDGAGDRAKTATPAPKGPIGSKAPVLVFCQRQGEGGATLDAITVRTDGTATLEKRHGGAGGRFKEQELREGVLPKLRAALAALPRSRDSLTRGSPPPLSTQFLLRYRGRTQTARQGGIVPAARPAVKLLDGLINGVGIKATTRDRATHKY